MVIAAYFEEKKGAGKPREPRRKLLLEASSARASGEKAGVAIHDISATGLLLESKLALTAGEKIDIDLPHAGTTSAKIVWASGQLFGCQFDAPITTAALSAAQLRSKAGQAAPSKPPLPDESFGMRLHRLRNDKGLTLSQIATQLGVSKPTVWAWEQGKARPVDSRIEALSAALGVPPSELVPGRDSPALRDLLIRAREQIASAFGIAPDKVRIMIDL
jgi:transcriptional regulator with XRE-family HTH domain